MISASKLVCCASTVLSITCISSSALAQQGPIYTQARYTIAPLSLNLSKSSGTTETGLQGAQVAAKQIVRDVIDDLVTQGMISLDERASLLAQSTLTVTTQATTSTLGLGGTVTTSASGGGAGGGATPAYVVQARDYEIMLAYNTASKQTIGSSTTTSTLAVGSALLNPGSQTQGINFLLSYDLTRKPKSLYEKLMDGIAKRLLDVSGSPNYKTAVAWLLRDGDKPIAADKLPKCSESLCRGLAPKVLGLAITASTTNGEKAAAATTSTDTKEAAGTAATSTDSSPARNMIGIYSVYFRAGFALLDFTAADPSDRTKTLTSSGGVFSPSLGVQLRFGDYADQKKIHFGLQAGATGRLLFGDITQNSTGSSAIRTGLLDGRRQFWGLEATLFMSYGSVRPYVTWTHMTGPSSMSGFSGDQVVIGTDMLAVSF
jgi:hypothetical protein